jgi:hypothetical protein
MSRKREGARRRLKIHRGGQQRQNGAACMNFFMCQIKFRLSQVPNYKISAGSFEKFSFPPANFLVSVRFLCYYTEK